MNLSKEVNRLYDEYLGGVSRQMNRLARKARKVRMRKLLNDIDFDKRVWLRKVGLQPYSPMRTSLGSGMLVLVGAIVGAVAGMVLAPMRGEHLRKEMRERTGMPPRSDYAETRQQPARA